MISTFRYKNVTHPPRALRFRNIMLRHAPLFRGAQLLPQRLPADPQQASGLLSSPVHLIQHSPDVLDLETGNGIGERQIRFRVIRIGSTPPLRSVTAALPYTPIAGGSSVPRLNAQTPTSSPRACHRVAGLQRTSGSRSKAQRRGADRRPRGSAAPWRATPMRVGLAVVRAACRRVRTSPPDYRPSLPAQVAASVMVTVAGTPTAARAWRSAPWTSTARRSAWLAGACTTSPS